MGYEAKTFVYGIYSIHTREDFDYYLNDFIHISFLGAFLKRMLLLVIGRYYVLAWLLPRFDVFHCFFDGGFLVGTPLQFVEIQLLHLAAKKVIVMPYGGDVAVPTRTHSLTWRQGLMMHYPHLGVHEKKVLKWIEYFSKYADFVVTCLFHSETMPRWDLLTIHYYPIDTETWTPSDYGSSANGMDGLVTVVHAPNHRGLKGTEFLIRACRELQAEGYHVDLRLLERLPNTEVKRIMAKSDIVAEQFIHGYALTAMEAMSLAKPVLSNLSDDYYYQVHRLYNGLDECPIVNTPIGQIKENLRVLITDPQLRTRLGELSRQYVVKYHSYETVGRMWDAVYRKVWYGEDIDLAVWHPDRLHSVKTTQ